MSQSPFLFRNIGVLLVVLANSVLAVRLVLMTPQAERPGTSLAVTITVRALRLAYLTISVMTLMVAILVFGELEVLEDSRADWRRASRWSEVHTGMAATAVATLLGPPSYRSSETATGLLQETWTYQLHPLGPTDEGLIPLTGQADGTGGPLVVNTVSPGGDAMRRTLSEWIPTGYARARLVHEILENSGVLAFGGLLLLAAASLLPLGTRPTPLSWWLYTPVIALVLTMFYEASVTPGWRLDRLFLFPLYGIILVSWLIRLRIVFRSG